MAADCCQATVECPEVIETERIPFDSQGCIATVLLVLQSMAKQHFFEFKKCSDINIPNKSWLIYFANRNLYIGTPPHPGTCHPASTGSLPRVW